MKRIFCIFAVLLLLSACAAGEASSEVTLSENQREVYGMVSAMVGNEMTLTLGSYTAGAGMDAAALPGDAAAEGEQPTRENPEQDASGGQQPPELPGGSTEGGTPPEGMGQTATAQQSLAMPGSTGTGGFVSTGEEATYLLPVDVPVTISGSDATTSFRRIAAENLVRLVLEQTAQGEQVVRVEIIS